MEQGVSDYKRRIEKERPLLTVAPGLITIDGPDGAGKSLIAGMLLSRLRQELGEDKVVLFSSSRPDENAPRQGKLSKLIKSGKFEEDRLDQLFVALVNRIYGESIIPALNDGKIVIFDRSEVALLGHALANNNQDAVGRRKRYIQDGTITHRLWAGNRIFVTALPVDIWNNLVERGKPSQYDPKNLEEVSQRIQAQSQAEREIGQMVHQGKVNIIGISNRRIEHAEGREVYLNGLIEEIMGKINLVETKI
jgi:hypothetical protein